MSELSPDQKVYQAQGGRFSIFDLFASFTDPDLQVDRIPRITDLHMKVGEPVCYRFDNELEPIKNGEALTEDLIRKLVFPLINESQRAAILSGRTKVVEAGYFWEAARINFRLNLFYDRDGLACVLRMLPKRIPALDQLGFLREGVWSDLAELRQGLVLVTGVTGSGKSTTVASLLDYINKSRKARIITLEDPIEYVFQSEQSLVSQRELHTHIDSFAEGLRWALRENPDVIYVGEIRDTATASLALSAAESGKLVLATMHTKDVTSTFGRFMDMFPAERSNEIATQLSFSLAYVVSQKLLARSSGKGHVPAFEVLKNVKGVGHLICSSKIHQVPGKLETGAQFGMNTLEQHLRDLVERGIVTREEAIRHANDLNLASCFTS